MNGLLVINKEQEYTSFDVVAVVRRILSEKKVGHLGTLDPMATGVLPVLAGRATKLGRYLPSGKKTYIASFKTGLKSDTDDIWGQVEKTASRDIAEDELIHVLASFEGKQEQIPPMYSAKKVNGVKLYKLARQGIEIERKPCKIEIFSIRYLGMGADGDFRIEVSCSEGTYIRTLIRDIGKALGTDALMTSLERTFSHGFSISESLTLKELLLTAESGEADRALIPIEKLLSGYVSVNVSQKQAFRFQNGGRLSLERLSSDLKSGYCRVLYGDRLIALGEVDCSTGEIKPVFQNERL